ncbi:MAG TPA: N-acetyl-gamma-glutamyl-phosphate reductase [Candidatus Limnocylindria bacterium]|nr:N-acetyl-gamma-glutamyl-phosphate reductase [Candidatus Limnocylindria bacterium]
MSDPVRVAVVGASGYAGAELVRILAGHPHVATASMHARGRDGAALAEAHPHLAPLDLRFTDGHPEPGSVDVAFLALPSGSSAELAIRLAEGGTTAIDIGSDLRLRDPAAYPAWYGFEHPAPAALESAVYGLTELARNRLPGARLIANPGCYPTAALLALVPFARAGLLTGDVVVDAKSGVSGAGRGAGADYLYPELEGGTKPYGIGGHRHQPEIAQGLADAGAPDVTLTFVPHLVPQVRGIVATCYLALAQDRDDEALGRLLLDAYDGEPFVHVLDRPPSSKLPWGSNHAFVHAARSGPRRAVVVAAIDNLGKGAAGQAVQNMNVALGLPETAGLAALGIFP